MSKRGIVPTPRTLNCPDSANGNGDSAAGTLVLPPVASSLLADTSAETVPSRENQGGLNQSSPANMLQTSKHQRVQNDHAVSTAECRRRSRSGSPTYCCDSSRVWYDIAVFFQRECRRRVPVFANVVPVPPIPMPPNAHLCQWLVFPEGALVRLNLGVDLFRLLRTIIDTCTSLRCLSIRNQQLLWQDTQSLMQQDSERAERCFVALMEYVKSISPETLHSVDLTGSVAIEPLATTGRIRFVKNHCSVPASLRGRACEWLEDGRVMVLESSLI